MRTPLLRITTAVWVLAFLLAGVLPTLARKISISPPGLRSTAPSDTPGRRAIRPVRGDESDRRGEPSDLSSIGNPFFSSPHSEPIALSQDGTLAYVANTPADTLDVIDTATGRVVQRIDVGIDPVTVAVRPDGKETWVSNHVSDTVSVVDTDSASPTFHQVIATVSDYDMPTRSTRFDEPVGIAFASNSKAYVALSSENQIAVVDVASRRVTKKLEIGAQDPRAITVRGGRLYVTAFESGNQTELSGCLGEDAIDGDQCTFDLLTHVVVNNNVLSLYYDADIVRDPNVPDRDLFVFDTEDDSVIDKVSSIGTLLYGVAVDSEGRVYIAQTEARNDANGRAGTLKHELIDLENRAFLNQIGTVDCTADRCGMPSVIELEPLLPDNPTQETALATPFGIQITEDDRTLVVTAASSSRLFTVDVQTGMVLGRVDVGWIPRGVALGPNDDAWVLNAIGNTVSHVDLSDLSAPRVVETITLEDPTPADVKLGRFAFMTGKQSSNGTYSCESCHPDGHTDQLLWVLGGPACEIDGCTQIPVRSTMPIRGARDTAPYHWDGVPGDPFGGRNGMNPFADFPPNCTTPESCTRHVIDGALAETMCDLTNCPTNDEGKKGLLTAEERDAMARYLLAVPPVPARERPIDDRVTPSALQGFNDFFVNGNRGTCGNFNCHKMPFWTGTNIGGFNGMDAPSFRGMQDRHLVLPQGRSNPIELLSALSSSPLINEVPFDFEKGFDELSMWALTFGTEQQPALNRLTSGYGPFDVWQMFLEGGMGTHGAYGRQITLNAETVGTAEATMVLDALEQAARDDAIILKGEGVLLEDGGVVPFELRYEDGRYGSHSREELLDRAAAGDLVLTLTGRIGPNVTINEPQPEIWSDGDPSRQMKHVLSYLPRDNPMRLFGRHILPDATVFVNGRRVGGSVRCATLTSRLPDCRNEAILVSVDEEDIPAESGMHLVQVKNPGGFVSNDFMFFVD